MLMDIFLQKNGNRETVRRQRELLDLLQREDDPLGPGHQQGQHCRLQEREDDPRHPDLSESTIKRQDRL